MLSGSELAVEWLPICSWLPTSAPSQPFAQAQLLILDAGTHAASFARVPQAGLPANAENRPRRI